MDARLERLRAIIEHTVAERDQLIEDRDRLIEEAKDLMRERDDAREYADCEKQFADGLKKRIAELEIALYDEQAHCEDFWHELKRAVVERDQARKCAEEMRDLYAAEIDESIAAFPFPWEDDHGADRDGE